MKPQKQFVFLDSTHLLSSVDTFNILVTKYLAKHTSNPTNNNDYLDDIFSQKKKKKIKKITKQNYIKKLNYALFQDQEPVKKVIQPTSLPTIQDGHQNIIYSYKFLIKSNVKSKIEKFKTLKNIYMTQQIAGQDGLQVKKYFFNMCEL